LTVPEVSEWRAGRPSMKLRFVSRQAHERNPTDGRGEELKGKRAILNSTVGDREETITDPKPLISRHGVTVGRAEQVVVCIPNQEAVMIARRLGWVTATFRWLHQTGPR
jgi:hypothetical protein